MGSVQGRSGGWRGVRAGALAVVVSLGLTACGNLGPSALAAPSAGAGKSSARPAAGAQTPAPQSGPQTVAIRHNAATPATIHVSTGETIKVRNFDSVEIG